MLKFTKIEAKNLYSFKELRIEYSKGLTLVTGQNLDSTSADSNYSGKSNALVEIPLWILYEKGTKEISPDGKTVAGYSMDSAIFAGANEAWGKASFEINDTQYFIERSRNRNGKSSLVLAKENGPNLIMGRDKAGTQKLINDLIGDYSTFTQIVFFAQGTKRFTEAKDSERKEVLEALLGLEDYSKALDCTRKRSREKIKEIEDLKNNADMLEIKKEEALKRKDLISGNLKKEQEEYDNWQREHESDIEIATNALKAEYSSCMELIKKVKELEFKIKTFADCREDKYEKEIEELDKAIKDGRNKIASINTEIKINQNKIDKLKSMDKCPECMQNILEAHKISLIHNLKKEIKDKTYEVKDLSVDTETRQKNLEEYIQELTEYSNNRTELVRIKRELTLAKESYDTAKTTLNIIKARKRQKPDTKELITTINEITKLKTEIDTIITEFEKIKKELDELKFWEEGFGNSGIKSLLFDSVLPILNEKANEYAATLVGEPIELEFDTESVLKSGGIRDRFDIRVITSGGNSYASCSVGQRGRIDFAVAMALQTLQASRGNRINLFVCDEPFESIDSAGQDGIIELLREFADENDLCVYVITHLEGLKTRFNDVLEIVKTKGISILK